MFETPRRSARDEHHVDALPRDRLHEIVGNMVDSSELG
jgi:hypothetical protein